MVDNVKASEESVTIEGPVGQLQSLVMALTADRSVVTIVCHPHPLFGGTMNNKVVHTLVRARRYLGHGVVRFNFRGVGASEGQYDEGQGEQQDLLAVCRWVQQQWQPQHIALAGFSFGAYVAAATCHQACEAGFPINHLLLVAPAVENYSFDQLLQFQPPMGLIYGDADEVVEPTAIKHWFESVTSAKQQFCLPGASHFFHGRLTELKQIVQQQTKWHNRPPG